MQWKVQELLDLQEEGQGSGLMWWTSPSLNSSTDLLVPPDLLQDVRAHLKSNKIEFDVILYDLQVRYIPAILFLQKLKKNVKRDNLLISGP